MIIYKVTNKVNGKVYIGKTVQTLSKRKANHYKCAKGRSETNFHRALRKYNKWDFFWEIIETITNFDEIDSKEMYWIAENKSYTNGYNMTNGGTGGFTYKKGDVLYDRIKEKLGKWKNGNPGATPEAIAKRKQSTDWANFPKGLNHGNYGQHPQKPNLIGAKNPMYGKTPTNAVKFEVNGIIYDSISQAARAHNTYNEKIKKIGKII